MDIQSTGEDPIDFLNMKDMGSFKESQKIKIDYDPTFHFQKNKKMRDEKVEEYQKREDQEEENQSQHTIFTECSTSDCFTQNPCQINLHSFDDIKYPGSSSLDIPLSPISTIYPSSPCETPLYPPSCQFYGSTSIDQPCSKNSVFDDTITNTHHQLINLNRYHTSASNENQIEINDIHIEKLQESQTIINSPSDQYQEKENSISSSPFLKSWSDLSPLRTSSPCPVSPSCPVSSPSSASTVTSFKDNIPMKDDVQLESGNKKEAGRRPQTRRNRRDQVKVACGKGLHFFFL